MSKRSLEEYVEISSNTKKAKLEKLQLNQDSQPKEKLKEVSESKDVKLKRKVLVLDLDETLMHTRTDIKNKINVYKTNEANNPPDLSFNVKDFPLKNGYRLYKRPKADLFLDKVSHWYELMIYTASTEEYGSKVSDFLDSGRGILNRRFYRKHCSDGSKSYTKDLKLVDEDLSNIVILDNCPYAYENYKENGVPIKNWYEDKSDSCFEKLVPFFEEMRNCNDVREFIESKEFKLAELLYKP